MIVRVLWQLAEDGGGTAWVMEGLEDSKWMFDSLDVLPDWIAEIIRKDGRREGQYVRNEADD